MTTQFASSSIPAQRLEHTSLKAAKEAETQYTTYFYGMSVEASSRNSDNKFRKKVKVAIGKSKGSKDDVGVGELKEKSSKKVKSRGSKNGDTFYVDMNKKSGKEGVGRKKNLKLRYEDKEGVQRKRNLKSRNEDRRFEAVIEGNSGRKRKIIYADIDIGKERALDNNGEIPNRKSLSKRMENKFRYDSGKRKQTTRAKSYEFEEGSRKASIAGGRTSKESKLLDKKNLRGKVQGTNEVKIVEDNGLKSGMLRRSAKNKYLPTQKLDQGQRKQIAYSVEKSHKKMFRGKKSSASDIEVMEDQPKKKKKVIRIDPHDFSNKRLDDGIASKDNSEENKDSADTNGAEMSKNAQFRAIRPSPSILSFVEDNFLGRRRDVEFRRAGYNTELSAPLDNIPFSTSSERERIEVPVFRNKLTFFAAAKISSSFPPPEFPEIAFAGRSNVGKSSLLNAVTRQWGVVRTSDKPGLTQTINFFKLGSKLHLVDLPGYGFAYAKEEVKEEWEALVKEYVSTRVGLKRVCLLVDTKWGMKPRDHELIDLMERSQTKYQIVLTKTDLVFPIDVARRAMQIEESLKSKKSAVQPVMMISSNTGAGIRSLRTALANIVRFVKR
ncbi:uncharacterized protein Fot_00688 [Forsythia ovata]|uniref:EngB-type G domain-containing protein n=1 Tax=Forsythia ovata TaxID=205694 RepID=A0ABD1X229_9LAMI